MFRMGLFVIGFSFLCVALPVVAQDTGSGSVAGQAKDEITSLSLCSELATVEVVVTFINNTSETVNVYWLDYQCQEILYATLRPGMRLEQSTYVLHPWRVRSASTQTVLMDYAPTSAEPAIVSISAAVEEPSMTATPKPAQNDRTDITGDYSVVVPGGWALAGREGRGTQFVHDGSKIVIYDPLNTTRLVPQSSRDDLNAALISIYNRLFNYRIDEKDLESEQFNGHDAALWYYTYVEQEGTQGVFILQQLDDASLLAIDIYGPEEAFDDNLKVARALARSLRSAEELAQSTGQPCLVSTRVERSASLRVGPGEHRTSVAFLPAGEDFVVLAQSTDDDSNIWFKLEKEEAAPRSAANEIWVLSDSVTTSGDCDLVVDAEAPPVVPIVNPPPPDNGGGNDNPPIAGNIVPLSGTWTISFARQTNASCAGTDNFVINTYEAWENWTEANYVGQASLSSSGGGTFIFNEVQYIGTGNNRYTGTWSFADGSNVQLYVTVISPTMMSGQMTGNYTYEGVDCSVTTDLTITRNG